jgi:hypothetical protein
MTMASLYTRAALFFALGGHRKTLMGRVFGLIFHIAA